MKKIIACLLVFMVFFLSACQEKETDTKVVLTTGFRKNEVFKIETMSGTLPELLILLTNTQKEYENIFGEEIWETDLDGVKLEERVKENVLAQLSQIKTMNLLAQQHGVVLTEEEKQTAKMAATDYLASLNETEIKAMQVTVELVEKMYCEYALADKVYAFIIRDINPEISDDEARTITVQHILFHTYEVDGTGQKIEYSAEDKAEIYRKARQVLRLAREEDSDFERLILEYSDDEKSTYSFGKGEVSPVFEEAAFNLGTGEISDVIETAYGYHIIKCISTFNREETDANKVKIVEERKKEVFGEEYEAFVETLTRELNEKLWEEVTLLQGEDITTDNFTEIYQQYFGK